MVFQVNQTPAHIAHETKQNKKKHIKKGVITYTYLQARPANV
jgi:hypothetical protein